MLTGILERIRPQGGFLGQIVEATVMPDLRNSEGHETLYWDGFAEKIVTETARRSLNTITDALDVARSFINGCEAGLNLSRALGAASFIYGLPGSEEVGRMPTWRRIHAYFGTNRLRIVDASLNTRDATARVERLAMTDINPCFQALILAHRLEPAIETFAVYTSRDEATISVDTAALEATMPVWEFAIAHLDQMPLSTFLPMNWTARSGLETESVAARSTAWIAADDAVGVIDGSPLFWSDSDRWLIIIRLRLVEMAVRATLKLIGREPARLVNVADSISELRGWIEESRIASQLEADASPALDRLRLQWERWGPVPRHPQISDVDALDLSERQPSLRTARGGFFVV